MPHSIFGWDLPPGCSVNDIPGNRPEDGIAEAINDAFYDNTGKRFTKDEWKYLGSEHRSQHLEDIIWKAIEYGMDVGRQQERDAEEDNKYWEEQAKEHNENKAFEEYYERATERQYPRWYEMEDE